MRQVLAAALFCIVSAAADIGNLHEAPLVDTLGACITHCLPGIVSRLLSSLAMTGAILSQSRIGDIGDASLFGLLP